ncbi:hypothetical protein ACTNEN_07025 [Oribacterium sp. HCP28S3_H8]|uniref:hypothetical protein n=1 Tax=Oribacterium sp. HCP28S3_H8 TaxID=3438945 RepID=UPI003F8AD175
MNISSYQIPVLLSKMTETAKASAAAAEKSIVAGGNAVTVASTAAAGSTAVAESTAAAQTDLRRQLLDTIKAVNPLNLFMEILYVCGVVLLIYALMQLVPGFQQNDESFKKRGFKFLVIAVILILIGKFIRF